MRLLLFLELSNLHAPELALLGSDLVGLVRGVHVERIYRSWLQYGLDDC